MPALKLENRSVAVWTCLWHAALALLLAVAGWCGAAVGVAHGDASAVSCATADTLGAPIAAVFAADADDHEECALVEGAPETSEDDVALPWPTSTEDLSGTARARAQATMGVCRQAPAWRKSARGPPTPAN